jgi:hypothetical protein
MEADFFSLIAPSLINLGQKEIIQEKSKEGFTII